MSNRITLAGSQVRLDVHICNVAAGNAHPAHAWATISEASVVDAPVFSSAGQEGAAR